MTRTPLHALAACCMAITLAGAGLISAPSRAEGAAPMAVASPASAAASAPKTAEPQVQRTVVDDRLARVEELKVRGQTKRIQVETKGLVQSHYDVLPADPGAGKAGGQRVWQLFAF